MESIDELAVKLKRNVGRWEEEIFSWACSLAQEVAKALLENIDEELMTEKDQNLKVEKLSEHRITTVFGNVKIKRRLYRDGNGEYRFLLDEKMGLDKGHRLVGKLTEPYLEEEETEIKEVYESGVIPESEGKVVPYLFIEADGTNIALHREEARRAEVKAGVAYEGWQKVSEGRYRVAGKTVYTGIMEGERFWEGFSLWKTPLV